MRHKYLPRIDWEVKVHSTINVLGVSEARPAVSFSITSWFSLSPAPRPLFSLAPSPCRGSDTVQGRDRSTATRSARRTNGIKEANLASGGERAHVSSGGYQGGIGAPSSPGPPYPQGVSGVAKEGQGTSYRRSEAIAFCVGRVG